MTRLTGLTRRSGKVHQVSKGMTAVIGALVAATMGAPFVASETASASTNGHDDLVASIVKGYGATIQQICSTDFSEWTAEAPLDQPPNYAWRPNEGSYTFDTDVFYDPASGDCAGTRTIRVWWNRERNNGTYTPDTKVLTFDLSETDDAIHYGAHGWIPFTQRFNELPDGKARGYELEYTIHWSGMQGAKPETAFVVYHGKAGDTRHVTQTDRVTSP